MDWIFNGVASIANGPISKKERIENVRLFVCILPVLQFPHSTETKLL